MRESVQHLLQRGSTGDPFEHLAFLLEDLRRLFQFDDIPLAFQQPLAGALPANRNKNRQA